MYTHIAFNSYECLLALIHQKILSHGTVQLFNVQSCTVIVKDIVSPHGIDEGTKGSHTC